METGAQRGGDSACGKVTDYAVGGLEHVARFDLLFGERFAGHLHVFGEIDEPVSVFGFHLHATLLACGVVDDLPFQTGDNHPHFGHERDRIAALRSLNDDAIGIGEGVVKGDDLMGHG